jgi:hypothetical protein
MVPVNAVRIGDREIRGGRRGGREVPDGRLLVALDSVAVLPPTVTVEPTRLQRRGGFGALLHGNQRLQIGVHVDLLLDRSKLDELVGELVGVERIERILILQLRGQQATRVLGHFG